MMKNRKVHLDENFLWWGKKEIVLNKILKFVYDLKSELKIFIFYFVNWFTVYFLNICCIPKGHAKTPTLPKRREISYIRSVTA